MTSTASDQTITLEFNDTIVRRFMLASIFWGITGMVVGILIATQLNFWQANFDLPWLTFGRLRAVHTNVVIFAFVGNMIFAGVYYSTQRLVKARLASDLLSNIHFWGWQLVIVAAGVTLPQGFTRSKEYAELIWPINILVVIVWVIFAINFFWTLARRREPTLYVAIWFYIGTIITVAMLYIVNHLSIPTSLLHSYPVFGGMQDALVQWWYGHNAVAFFLTTPILGIMYYFLPKAADRPVYSYRLSVIHFWSLVFIYIWAGPHHLLNTALPGWLQSLGMVFSLMLWAPSWGGMLNGLLTLRGAWDKLRTDPVLKFFAAAVTFYGMATFEGPLLSIKSVNALGHYTDWIVGHVHAGALGWNGFMAAGMFYWLAPRLWNKKLYSVGLANLHFWLGLVGILFYVGALWVAGITQGLMLNATAEQGTLLAYPNFLETLKAIQPMMLMRVFGGLLYVAGWVLLAINIIATIRGGTPVNGTVTVFVPKKDETVKRITLRSMVWNAPVLFILVSSICICAWVFGGDIAFIVGGVASIFCVILACINYEVSGNKWAEWYDRLLVSALPFSILTFLAVVAGGLIQIIPMVIAYGPKQAEGRLQIPYTPLELAGRDIYVREGCYNCHSQMIRTIVPDVLRYGDYSRLGESAYDHPSQAGSRRIGPDLARVGGKYSDEWHYQHMEDPRSVSSDSNMPNYPWLNEYRTDMASLPKRFAVMRTLGVPYPEDLTPEQIIAQAEAQAKEIADNLREKSIYVSPDREIVALIAYLQRLGKFEKIDNSER